MQNRQWPGTLISCAIIVRLVQEKVGILCIWLFLGIVCIRCFINFRSVNGARGLLGAPRPGNYVHIAFQWALPNSTQFHHLCMMHVYFMCTTPHTTEFHHQHMYWKLVQQSTLEYTRLGCGLGQGGRGF